MKARSLSFSVSEKAGSVSALLLCPDRPRILLVFGHGAGAGMRHPFMESVAQRLVKAGIATFRYQFPYMEKKAGRPDPKPVLLATVHAAVRSAAKEGRGVPLLAGGKSMGGRMTSLAQADGPLEGVRGLVFFGFPLHPPGAPGTERAQHLAAVQVPMLFLQGTRDKLADLNLLRPICTKLPRSTLSVLDGADHSFHMTKGSGISDAQAIDWLADTVEKWISAIPL